jgi:hypothetical protein
VELAELTSGPTHPTHDRSPGALKQPINPNLLVTASRPYCERQLSSSGPLMCLRSQHERPHKLSAA